MNKTIFAEFSEMARKYSDKPALMYKKEGQYLAFSYAELLDKVNQLAGCWRGLATERGVRVAILSENRPEWVITDLACQNRGLITVPIHTTLSAAQIEFILKDSQSAVLVVSNNELWQKIASAIEQTEISLVIHLEPITSPAQSQIKFLEFQKILAEQSTEPLAPQCQPQDIASIIYTSGTTGNPKGVMLTQENFLVNIEEALKAVPIHSKDRFLSFLPLSHVLERTAGYYGALVNGATIAYAQSPKTVGEDIGLVRPTILVSVPRIFEKIYEGINLKFKKNKLTRQLSHWALQQKRGTLKYRLANILIFSKIKKKMGGRLRLAISGGASLNPHIAKFFAKIGLPIVEGYGLTETSPIIAVNTLEKNKFGTVGFPLKNLQVKIAPDKEILVKGPSVMKGYYNNEEATKAAFAEEGWFKTGDLGFFDEEGFLTIIGRKKEMIVTSYGKNISPEKLESTLNLNKYIAQSMVIGNGRQFLTAIIVPDWKYLEAWAEENLPRACRGAKNREEILKNPRTKEFFKKQASKDFTKLAHHEQIAEFILREKEFTQESEELTPTLKVRREIIQHNHQKEIEKIYKA